MMRFHHRIVLVLPILIWSLVIPFYTNAQPYWAYDLGSAGNDLVADVKANSAGEIFITGEFSGSPNFLGQTLVSTGALDLFVAKLNADGTLAWCVTGGGSGVDRGLKVAIGADGSVVVAGLFMGSATFFGSPLTSAGGTPDMLLAKLNGTTGALQWIAQGGGSTGMDRPYGVSVSAAGKVAVAGEFIGTAQWGSVSLSSTLDPNTLLPTPDVFIASYSSTGTVEWVQQGAADAADRAIDVVHDASGNVFVTGQFSNNITFDVLHANTLANATFLLKLNAAGDEQWFRRCGGAAFNYVRDMLITSSGELILTGDQQGNMLFFDDATSPVNSSSVYAYYILRVSTTGQLTASGTLGSSSPLSVAGITLHNDTLAVIGTFNCRFSGLGDHYGGDGLFMAAGDEDLFVARHRLSTLALTDGQQFGGREGKTAGQIAALPDGALVFCGSYEQDLFFPSNTETFDADLENFGFTGQTVTAPHCDDDWAGMYVGNLSAGANDGFVARGYVKGRSPYDFWPRAEADCEFDTGPVCITLQYGSVCLDSIVNCGSVSLRAWPGYSYYFLPQSHFLGPDFSVLWSNGSTSETIVVTTTGWYEVTITSLNGCMVRTGSIYVEVLPAPSAPLISDDVPFNTNNSSPVRIDLCEPDSVWIWGNTPPGTTYYWVAVTDGDTTFSDSIHTGTSGGYTYYVENAEGCVRSSTVIVAVAPVLEMPDLTVDLEFTFSQDTASVDSVHLCSNEPLLITYTPTWMIDGLVDTFPTGLVIMTRLNGGSWVVPPDPEDNTNQQGMDSTGWFMVDFDVLVTNAPCGEDTLFFNAADSIWVGLYPAISVTVAITGESVMCPDDSLLLSATCVACDSILWSGPNILLHVGNTIIVGGAGLYSASAMATDSHGCVYSAYMSHPVTVQLAPVLQLDPTDGVLCPGSGATITSSQTGDTYEWYGPGGLLPDSGPSITTDVPGEYYMILSTSIGCEFVSDQVSLTNYATPYLNVSPQPVLCAGAGPVTLQVVTAAVGGVQWSAPLSGTSLTQTISAPGTYTCAVTSCGIVTQLSVTITAGGAQADLLTPGPLTICPGDSVTMQAVPGQPNYTWSPGGSTGPTLVTNVPGMYTVVASDDVGCSDTSAVIVVNEVFYSIPVTGSDTSICWGLDGVLTASGSGVLVWYAGPQFNTPYFTGDTLIIPQPPDSMVFHVVQQEGGCTSDPIVILLNVTPIISPISLSGPDHVCADDPIIITMAGDPNLTVDWVTPTGTATGNPLVIDPSSPADGGTYVVHPRLGPCLVVPEEIVVPVYDPMVLPWADSEFCTGGALNLNIPPEYSSPVWSNGSQDYHVQIIDPGSYALSVIDPNGCPIAMAIEVTEVWCDLVIPNVFTPNGDGINDLWTVQGGFIAADLHVYNRWGILVFTGDLFNRVFQGRDDGGGNLSEGVYYYVLDLGMTRGRSKQVSGYFHIQR